MHRCIQSFIFLAFIASLLQAQSPTENLHSGKNSLTWQGTYTGILPCADCPGIETSVTLFGDSSYRVTTRYQERQDTLYERRGKFSWSEDGNNIVLQETNQAPAMYRLRENALIQLDMEGNIITGPLAEKFVLRKIDGALFGHGWKLIELKGKPVGDSAMTHKEIFLQLELKENRLSGFSGCNRFFGHYELKEGNRIHFSAVGSTLMACPEMDVESEFLKVLQLADSYTIRGSFLHLNKARMATLAVLKRAE